MVFEGHKTEPAIVKNLTRYFLRESEHTIIKAIYGTVIYKLYREFYPDDELDDDLDLFPTIKAMIDGNELDTIERSEVSQIYLFFDYDGHASNAGDEKLQAMLKLFDNETEKGKLFVSYPMVEAIKHLHTGVDFKETEAVCDPNYKKRVNRECNPELMDINRYHRDQWDWIISAHCQKANFITQGEFTFPENIITQLALFHGQKRRYIHRGVVAVLSAFPLFLLEQYGTDCFSGEST